MLQFGDPPAGEPNAPPSAEPSRAKICPACASRFSEDARFCPFDASLLVPAPARDDSSDPLLGHIVDGRYEVLGILGEGGMGTVYEVRHAALGKRFALKALRKDLAQDDEIAARFIQEARTAAAVSHPGVVELTDFGRMSSGQVYLVMELLEGQTLGALLRKSGPLPLERGLGMVRQLAHALGAAHAAGIVHRDLKPDNIHVAPDDRVTVVDFGLAKVIGSSKLTRAGMVFGTPHYMSPEQAAGEALDHRADIYALGIVMYEMFTGKLPFEADSYMGVLSKHLYALPVPPSQLGPDLQSLGPLEGVILRCLQKNPSDRYEHLTALLGELDQMGSQSEASATEHAPSPQAVESDEVALPLVHPQPSRRLAAYFLALGVLLLVGAALGWALRQRPSVVVPRPGSSASPLATAIQPVPSAPPAPEPSAPTPATGEPESAREAGSFQNAPARKPNPTSQRGSLTSSPKSKPSSNKRRIGDGEIVDPWAH